MLKRCLLYRYYVLRALSLHDAGGGKAYPDAEWLHLLYSP